MRGNDDGAAAGGRRRQPWTPGPDIGRAPVLVTSPPLAQQARQRLQAHFPSGRVLVWQQGTPADLRGSLRRTLLATGTPVCISFYNDYIFCREEIAAFACLVNIHPALPSLRGRGYDTLPILQSHRDYGATLHFVSEEIDAGPIIAVMSQPLPQPVEHARFRRMTQELSLVMLEQLLQRCLRTGLDDLAVDLKQQAIQAGLQWSGERLTSSQLADLLRDVELLQPHHPVLHGLRPRLQATAADAPLLG